MPRYRVLMDGWTDASGKHEEGETVELSRDTPEENAEVDRLINYGIVEPATAKKPTTRSSPKASQD
jgi:hypothetical protein